MTGLLSRRHLLQLAGAGLAAISLPNLAFAAPGDKEIWEVPAGGVRPRLRWWWPGAYVEPDEVRREVKAMADAGFGGFEIADVRDSVKAPLDPKVYGWGSDRWNLAVQAALEAALAAGIKADITIGAHWPTGMPGVLPDSDAAAKELIHGAVTLKAGEAFKGAVPAPEGEPAGLLPKTGLKPQITPVLLAVQAARIVSEGKSLTLDFTSLVDLTDQVKAGQLKWKAPKGGDWRLMAFWMRGTGQIQNMFEFNPTASFLADPVPYVVDIFGKAGAQACIDFWNTRLLPQKTRELLRQNGGSIFEDSLEMKAAQHWSPDMFVEFEKRRGYALKPYLATITLLAKGSDAGIFGKAPPPPYVFEGLDRDRLIHDFEQTLGEMYVDNRIRPIKAWADGLGMKFRVQCIGSVVDSGAAAAIADIPEGDNGCDMDGFRVLAAGRDIAGLPILSDEAATFVGGSAHVANMRTVLYMLQRDYAGGVNQVVVHGFPYAEAPGASWPGFSAFGRDIGDDYGPRNPHWLMASDMTGYLGRLQKVLQSGRSVSDVAILHQAGGTKAHFRDKGLQRAGYTYQFPSIALLNHPNAMVSNGRLAAGGPAYAALVINRETAIAPETVARIAGFADAGLPIFVIGAAPAKAISLKNARSEDAVAASAMANLVKTSGVVSVADEASLPAALKAAGVAPAFGFDKPVNVVGVRREAEDGSYVYLLNDSEETASFTLSLREEGLPFHIDLWTGGVMPFPVFTDANGRCDIPLQMAPNTTVAFVHRKIKPGLSITSSEGELVMVKGNPTLRATTPGTYNVKVSDGRVFALKAANIPATLTLDHWQLSAESWVPGDTQSTTKKLPVGLTLDTLRPWTQISGLEQAAGIGHYVTEVDLGNKWTATTGAFIDLGKVGGTAQLFVNGVKVAVSPFELRADIGPQLKAGKNRIEVIVATPLNNSLKAAGIKGTMFDGPPPPGMGDTPKAPADATPAPDMSDAPAMQPGSGPPGGERKYQDNGLIGPVRIVPYTLVSFNLL